MAQEIELKFLVDGNFKPFATKKIDIVQAYISTQPSRSVRIRIQDGKGSITIKGVGKASGIMRFEWEQEIPIEDAKELLELRESGLINKTRYIVPVGSGLKFEIDEFHGDNQDLLMAEIELPSIEMPFTKPEWLGREITGDPTFYNAELSKNPYCNWKS